MAQVKYPIFNYKISPTNSTSGEMECWIDGAIVSGDEKEFYDNYLGENSLTSFNSFKNSILAANPTKLKVNINSQGGSLVEGIAMHDFIKDCVKNGMDVTMCGIGMVASSATLPFLAVDKSKRELTDNTLMIVHNCSGVAYGTVNEVESQAVTMRKMNDTIVNIYAASTSTSKADWQDMMDKETTITAKEAVKLGIISDTKPKSNFKNSILPSEWFFKNRTAMEIYNSYVPKENNMQEFITKITDAITNGFKSIGAKSHLPNEDVTNAVTALNSEITNAFTEMQVGIEAKVQDGIKSYLGGEEFKAAITAMIPAPQAIDTTEFATKADITAAAKEINTEVIETLKAMSGSQAHGNTPKKDTENVFENPYKTHI